MKKIVLTAIAFSERQWGKVLKLRKSFPECWDPEYAAGVCFVCTSKDLRYAHPYAKVLTFGTYEKADLIADEEKVVKALKRHRTFQRLKYGWAEIVWAYVSEFDKSAAFLISQPPF
jgi:ribosome-binding factor A